MPVTAVPAVSARAARGRRSTSAPIAPARRPPNALRHHDPMDIGERGLKMRSML